jgi:hypothetical protein
MSTLIKWIAAPILTVGLLTAIDAPQAEAQGFSFGSRGLSIQVGQHYPSYYRAPSYYYPGYSSYYSSRTPSLYSSYNSYRYGSPIRGSYGHYGCRPPGIYRHGSHYGGVPGHFNYHRVPSYRHGRHH